MKRFRYRLDAVLRVREIQHDVAVAAFETARHDRMRTEQLLAAAVAACEPEAVGAGATGSVMRAQRAGIDLAADRVGHVRAMLGAAEAMEATRRDELVDAMARVRGLENLRERQRAEHLHSSLREEELASAEMAAQRRHHRAAHRPSNTPARMQPRDHSGTSHTGHESDGP